MLQNITLPIGEGKPQLSQPFLNIPLQVSRHPDLHHPDPEGTTKARRLPKDLTKSAKIVYGVLKYHCRHRDRCRLLWKTIADESGCSRATVARALHELRGRPKDGETEFAPLIEVLTVIRQNTQYASWYVLLPLPELPEKNFETPPSQFETQNKSLEKSTLGGGTLDTYIPEPPPEPVCRPKKKHAPLTEEEKRGKAVLANTPLLARLKTPIREGGVAYTLKGKPLRLVYQRVAEHGLEHVWQIADIAEKQADEKNSAGAILYYRLQTDFQPELQEPQEPPPLESEPIDYSEPTEIPETQHELLQAVSEPADYPEPTESFDTPQEPPQDVSEPIDYSEPTGSFRKRRELPGTVYVPPEVLAKIRPHRGWQRNG